MKNPDFTPVDFPGANKTLYKPDNMTDDECCQLRVYADGAALLSCWKLTFWQRLVVLWTGHVWLSVLGRSTQPPVCIFCSGKSIHE